MAIAGDIIIKLAADFAEFAKGMEQSQKLLGDFGKKAEQVSTGIEDTFAALKKIAVIGAIFTVFNKVTAEVERLEKKFTDIAEAGKKLGYGFEAFEQLRVAAMKSGVGVDALAATMGKLKGVTDSAVQGTASTIAALDKLGVKILDVNGKQRSQEEINQRIAAAFDKMPAGIEKVRLQYALLGESGEGLDKRLKLIATSVSDLSLAAASSDLGKTIAAIKQMRDESEASREKLDLLLARIVLPLELKYLQAAAALVEKLINVVNGIQAGSVESLTKLLLAMGALGTGNVLLAGQLIGSAPGEITVLSDKLIAAKKQADELEASIQKAIGRGDANRVSNDQDALATLNAKRAEMEARFQLLTRPPQTMPAVNVTGDGRNPPPTATGGGGGKSDIETVDALILRYQKMEQAAADAQSAMRRDVVTDVRDLALVIEAKQAAAEAVAKIVARGLDVPQEKIDQLERSIFLSKQAQAEQQRDLQYTQQADATNKRLSGTTDGLADAYMHLNRQLASGRLNFEAYGRALAEVAEQQQHIRLQSTRMDNNITSLAAGFQDAALSYARANDMFSQGGALFNSVTGAMGEGLDVLSGKSTKTFGQIASDFATMLTKMALQAALSPVFKMLGNFLGDMIGSGGSAITMTRGPSVDLTPRAGGGAVYGGQPYWVGEYGPERFVPAGAGRIEPAGSGGGDVVVNIANYTDSKVSAQKGKGPNGQMQIAVIVEAVEGQMAQRMSRGQGALGKTIEGSYGLQRVGR